MDNAGSNQPANQTTNYSMPPQSSVPPQQINYAQPPAALPKSAMGITGFVLGIIAAATSFLPIINNMSFIIALIGLVFAIIGVVQTVKGKRGGKGLAIAGLVLCIASFVIVLATQSMYGAAIDSVNDSFNESMNGPAATSTSNSSSSTSTQSDVAVQEDFTNLAVGETVNFENGLSVTVNSYETGLTQSYSDKTYSRVTVTYLNNSAEQQSFNPYDWKGQDAQGVQRSQGFYTDGNNDLNSGTLAAGGTVTGDLYFEGDLAKVVYTANMFSDKSNAEWNVA